MKKIGYNKFCRNKHVAELCNGSTTDSDSVCWGSNPYSTATAPKLFGALLFRGVAQFGSAHRSGRWGRKFESCHLDQFSAELF